MITDQVVLLTGATGGIGREIAKLLAKEPITLILIARNKERLDELHGELSQFNRATLPSPVSCDLTSSLAIKEMVEQVIHKYGQIDHVVHAAGVGDFKPFMDFTVEEMDQMIAGNTQSVMYLFAHLLPYMTQRQKGRWSIIASSGGQVATPSSSVYSASKFAIIGLTHALRMEIQSDNIELAVINPGPVDTPFHQQSPQMAAYLDKVKWIALNPKTVAQKIVNNMKRSTMKKEMTFPWFLALAAKGYALAPRLADWIITHFFNYKEENQ